VAINANSSIDLRNEIKAYNVPIKEYLESILKHPSVFAKVIESFSEPDDSQKGIIKS